MCNILLVFRGGGGGGEVKFTELQFRQCFYGSKENLSSPSFTTRQVP